MSSLHITADSIQTSPALSFPNSTKLTITSGGISSNNGGSVSLITPNKLLISNQSILSASGASLAPISDASTAYDQGILISGDVSGVAPGAPTINNATNGAFGQVTIDFTLSTLGSGSSVTSLTFYAYIGGVLSTTQTTSTLTSPYTFTGVNAGSTYTFKMSETNATGEGGLSNESNAVNVPYPATIVSASINSAAAHAGTVIYLTVTIDSPAQGNIPITITPSDPLLICYAITGTLIIPTGQTYAETPVLPGFFDGASHDDIYITASVGISSMETQHINLYPTSVVTLNLPALIPYGNNVTGTVSTSQSVTIYEPDHVQWDLSLSDNTIASLDVNSVNQYNGASTSDPFTITAFTLVAPQTLTVYASPSYQNNTSSSIYYSVSASTQITDYIPAVPLSIDIDCSYSNVGLGGNFLGYSQNDYGNMAENTTITGTLTLDGAAASNTDVIIAIDIRTSYSAVTANPFDYLSFPDAINNGDGTITVTVPAGQTSVTFTVVGGSGNFTNTDYYLSYYDSDGSSGTFYPWIFSTDNGVTFNLNYNPATLSATGGAYRTSSISAGKVVESVGISSDPTKLPLRDILLIIPTTSGYYMGGYHENYSDRPGQEFIDNATSSNDPPVVTLNSRATVQLGAPPLGAAARIFAMQLSSYQERPTASAIGWYTGANQFANNPAAGYARHTDGTQISIGSIAGSSNYSEYYSNTQSYIPNPVEYTITGIKWYGGGY
jgi:hypothetical protein